MKKLIPIAVALVVIAAGIWFGLIAMGLIPDTLGLGIGPPPTEESAAPPEPEQPPPPPPAEFVSLDDLVIPILRPDGPRLTLFLTVRLKVPPGGTTGLAPHRRRVADSFFRYLHDFLPRHMDDGRVQPDPDLLKSRLLTVARRSVDVPIEDVLIVSVYTR